jgi:hypothetical protein
MEEKMVDIRKNLKVAQHNKNIYADKNNTYKEFKVSKHVFFKSKG